MNIDTIALLRYSPSDSLLVIANESLGTSLNPQNSTILDVSEITGTLTEATILGVGILENCSNSYEGQQTFVFNRLDLKTLFGENFKIAAIIPTTVENILSKITAASGIVFDENDFADGVINTLSVTLSPLPQSRRWSGQLDIVLTA
jgi:hypothetical protein